MSHKAYVAVLACDQPAESRRRTIVPKDVADLLVQRMIAERITQRLYRMLPADSVFPVAKYIPIQEGFVSGKLPPAEIENCRFVLRQPDTGNVPRTRSLPRFRETYGENQLARSL